MEKVVSKCPVFINTKSFKDYAKSVIKSEYWSYYCSGSFDENTLKDNENAFNNYLFLPKMLKDVSKRSLNTNLNGIDVGQPFGIAPTALHKFAHFNGEIDTAKAAALTKTPMILSTLSSIPLENVAETYIANYPEIIPKYPLWFQLYVMKDRQLTREMIRRVENAGYSALVITVDTPLSGIRYGNIQNNLTHLPEDISFANFSNFQVDTTTEKNFFASIASQFDSSLTWENLLGFIRESTNLPIILKGILRADDAITAANYGVKGIIISNHGARQLDSVPSTIDCLRNINKISGQLNGMDVYIDGGIRNGSDIIKCLLLGAKFVFLGRPFLWSLAYNGFEGTLMLINILKNELDVNMALLGASNVDDLTSDLIVQRCEF